MKKLLHIYITIFTLSLIVTVHKGFGQGRNDAHIFSLEIPFIEDDEIFQKISYQLDTTIRLNVSVQCYQLRTADSVELYHLFFERLLFHNGANSVTLKFEKSDTTRYKNHSFFELLKSTGEVPPGTYHMHVALFTLYGDLFHVEDFTVGIDSTLSYNSDIRNRINNLLAPSHKKGRIRINNRNAKKDGLSKEELTRINTHINRKIGNKKGVIAVPEMTDDKAYSALYFDKWFLGRYEVKPGTGMKYKIEDERTSLKNKAFSIEDNSLSNFTSISSRTKKLYKKDNCDQETRGDLGFSTGFGNGQEPNSQQDNFYQEVSGIVHTTIKNVPVVLEGYYTTQDIGRQAKASYIRVHYDVEESKSRLQEKITVFKAKYNETKNMGAGDSYTHLISSLNSENYSIRSLFQKKYGFDIETMNGERLLPGIDVVKSGLADDERAKAREQYEKYEKNKQRIEKYSKILEQYNNKMYLDSAITYAKLNELNNRNPSYKELANATSDLLPESETSKFIRGVTNFDIGILNQYESDYTMSGQVLKGGGLGYDFGFVKTRATIGKTEYISRDGNVDAYNSYMLRADSRIYEQQNVGLIYYTYSPAKSILKSENFKQDVIPQSFMEPVHVLSFVYNGRFGDNLLIQSEGATSYNKMSELRQIGKETTAAKIGAEYLVKPVNSSIRGEWEHMGKLFENSAMPIKRNATERYTLGANATIVKSLIVLGVQYNFIKQSSFASTGYNKRWGFDVKTNFKRYPNLYMSYKPFTTFRAFNDTFSISQRPIIGEVTTSRLTYQVRKGRSAHRFMLMYNHNKNTAELVSYESKTVQLGYIYSSGMNMTSLNAGWMSIPANDSALSGDLYFINNSISKSINKNITVNGGPDIAWSKTGVEKLSVTAGLAYLFETKPIGLRLQFRYTHFTHNLYSDKNNLWAGLVGIDWHFKMKRDCEKIK